MRPGNPSGSRQGSRHQQEVGRGKYREFRGSFLFFFHYASALGRASSGNDTSTNNSTKMGYEMSLYLKVQPAEKFNEVADAIEERFGIRFDDNEDGSGYLSEGRTTWGDMDTDLRALTTDMPGVTVSVECDGDDAQEWIDHYRDGKTYMECRPEWVPEPFDESKLK